MRFISSKTLADLLLSMAALYSSFWIYELANYFSLVMIGANASLITLGVLPIGTTGISAQPGHVPLVLAKVVQVAISALPMFFLAMGARAKGLTLLQGSSTCLLSLFLASFYWEWLSQITEMSYGLHEILYAAVAIAVQLAITIAMRYHPLPGATRAGQILRSS